MSFQYFNKLNYSLANEDTGFEVNIAPKNMNHLLSVAGSGGRVLPIVANGAQKVTCVDLSAEQLYLTELRFAAAKILDHEDFLGLLGYETEDGQQMSAAKRKKIFKTIQLSGDAKSFLEKAYDSISWNGLVYEGKWEKSFAKISGVNRRVTGKAGAGVFECTSLEEQQSYMQEEFPQNKWKLVLLTMGNAGLFNALLYKGHFPKKNIPFSHVDYYKSAFNRLFDNTLARENFFLQIMFFGKIKYPEGNPIECNPEVYAKVQTNLKGADVSYVQGNIVEIAEKQEDKIDFLSLSDVPSYFSGETEKNFLQRARKGLAKDSLTIVRSYLRIPWRPHTSGFEMCADQFQDAIDAEKTQMYITDVYRNI